VGDFLVEVSFNLFRYLPSPSWISLSHSRAMRLSAFSVICQRFVPIRTVTSPWRSFFCCKSLGHFGGEKKPRSVSGLHRSAPSVGVHHRWPLLSPATMLTFFPLARVPDDRPEAGNPADPDQIRRVLRPFSHAIGGAQYVVGAIHPSRPSGFLRSSSWAVWDDSAGLGLGSSSRQLRRTMPIIRFVGQVTRWGCGEGEALPVHLPRLEPV